MRRRLRVPALVAAPRRGADRHGRHGGLRRDRLPVGPDAAATQLEETRDAVAAGADEIDMVISREAYLSGDDARVRHEIAQVKDACGDAHLKVILETAELGCYDHVRHASMLAMEARRRLHQDVDRQGRRGRHAGGRARDAGGDPRLRRRARAASSA